MLFTLAALCFLMVSVGADECRCITGDEKTSCKTQIWQIMRKLRKNLEWDEEITQLAKSDPLRAPEYEQALFWGDFEKDDRRTMEQKVNATIYKNIDYVKRAIGELKSESANFGCHCNYYSGDERDDMDINCFFQ
ncbi:hypothetical protein OSTOST_03630 [Ostertagia ostertagi]